MAQRASQPLDASPCRRSRATAFLAGAALAAILSACGGDNTVKPPGNTPPHLVGIVAVPSVVARGGVAQLTALASDRDNDLLSYRWSAAAGTFGPPSGARIRWTAPAAAGAFQVKVVVSDGTASDSTTTSVTVGSGDIQVDSDPPGAGIILNGSETAEVTPNLFHGLAATAYDVELTSTFFYYEPVDTVVTLHDGDAAHVRFSFPAARIEEVDIGPEAVDEIGGITYSAGGVGLLYVTRTGAATALRSASLVPTHGGTNGRMLRPDPDFDEPISLRVVPFQPAEIAFVEADEIHVGSLFDSDFDGLAEALQNVGTLRGVASDTYAPAFSQDGRKLAFALAPSTQPNDGDVLLAGDFDSTQVLNLKLVAGRRGNSPSYGPGNVVAFEAGGEIYRAEVDTLAPAMAFKLTDTGGLARSPAYSPDGRFVAYLTSDGKIELLVPAINSTTTLLSGVTGHALAWSPDGRELAFADNGQPGHARLNLLLNLPVRLALENGRTVAPHSRRRL